MICKLISKWQRNGGGEKRLNNDGICGVFHFWLPFQRSYSPHYIKCIHICECMNTLYVYPYMFIYMYEKRKRVLVMHLVSFCADWSSMMNDWNSIGGACRPAIGTRSEPGGLFFFPEMENSSIPLSFIFILFLLYSPYIYIYYSSIIAIILYTILYYTYILFIYVKMY